MVCRKKLGASCNIFFRKNSPLNYTRGLFVLFTNLSVVITPQDKIIEQLEANIRLLRDSVTLLELEIFEQKGDNKILKSQFKESTLELQKQHGYDDGNYVE